MWQWSGRTNSNVFGQSRGRSLCAVVSAVGRWRSSTTVVLSQSLTPVSCSLVRLTWCPVNHGRLCAWNEAHSVAFCVFSAVIGGCVGLMSVSVRMRRKRVVAFAVRDGCRELASEVVTSLGTDEIQEKFQIWSCQVPRSGASLQTPFWSA